MGIGIGSGTNQGTLGLLLRDPLPTETNDKFIGVTAGHVIQSAVVAVTQPEITEFTKRVDRLSKAVKDAKVLVQSPKSSVEIIRQAQNFIANVEPEYNICSPYLKSTASETALALLAGTVVKKVTKPYEFEDRRCLLDYAVFDVQESRNPQPQLVPRFYGGPDEGYLSEVDWQPMRKWGQVKLDDPVRKTGRTTGVTYGVVAGIYANWKSAQFPGETMKEYHVLRDEKLDEQSDISHIFAWKGDSGASVVDYQGRIVGFVSVCRGSRNPAYMRSLDKAP